jgi:hypothetical protein
MHETVLAGEGRAVLDVAVHPPFYMPLPRLVLVVLTHTSSSSRVMLNPASLPANVSDSCCVSPGPDCLVCHIALL